MKTEKYLLDHMMNNHISVKQVECDMGINMEQLVEENRDLKAGEFLALCAYLNIRPEEVRDQIL